METAKKVPTLRFPGFEGEWEEKKLKEICNCFSGGTPSTSNADYYGGGIPFIRSGEIALSKTELFLTERGLNNSSAKMIEKGDLLYAMYGATAGEVSVSKIQGAINQAILCIRSESINNKFLESVLLDDKNKITSTYLQGGQGNLSAEIIKNLKYHFPPLPEQQKITDCLTAMDDTIEAQQQKVEQLQAYKKGLLQQLFSQTLRFPEFEGAWEEKKLVEVVQNKKKGNAPDYENPKNLLLNNDFMENQAIPIYVGNDIDVKANDLLILWDGSQAGKVYTGFEGVLGSTFTSINFDSNTSHLFIHNALSHNLSTIQRVWREGSGIPHVAKDFIENYKIQLPSLSEQQKIADCLSSLDEIIELETQKLEQLRLYKKGLLQQMFV